jgi:hypothetical protein
MPAAVAGQKAKISISEENIFWAVWIYQMLYLSVFIKRGFFRLTLHGKEFTMDPVIRITRH